MKEKTKQKQHDDGMMELPVPFDSNIPSTTGLRRIYTTCMYVLLPSHVLRGLQRWLLIE